jgi:hypothetical protein
MLYPIDRLCQRHECLLLRKGKHSVTLFSLFKESHSKTVGGALKVYAIVVCPGTISGLLSPLPGSLSDLYVLPLDRGLRGLQAKLLTLTRAFLWAVFICIVLLRAEELYRLWAIQERSRPGLRVQREKGCSEERAALPEWSTCLTWCQDSSVIV